MRKIIERCIFPLIMICLIIAVLSGLYKGFILGRDSVCSDIAFYYNNDLPVESCIPKKNP